jgi:hypothetical protein
VTAAAILARLGELGVVAEVRGDGLVVRPASLVPADLLAEARAHKAELLARLRQPATPVAEAPAPPPGATGELGGSLFLCSEYCGGRWWRISAGKPGWSGRWYCGACQPQPGDRWCDAEVLPTGSHAGLGARKGGALRRSDDIPEG